MEMDVRNEEMNQTQQLVVDMPMPEDRMYWSFEGVLAKDACYPETIWVGAYQTEGDAMRKASERLGTGEMIRAKSPFQISLDHLKLIAVKHNRPGVQIRSYDDENRKWITTGEFKV